MNRKKSRIAGSRGKEAGMVEYEMELIIFTNGEAEAERK